MAKWLSQEWMDESRKMAEGQPERPGATARMQYVITGTGVPDGGEVHYYWILENGKLLDAKVGDLEDPEVTLTMSIEDHKNIQLGTLDANTAFMQGRIKVTGNMAKLMGLLPITNSPEYKALQNEILTITEF